jgi:hypothetical protein
MVRACRQSRLLVNTRETPETQVMVSLIAMHTDGVQRTRLLRGRMRTRLDLFVEVQPHLFTIVLT